MTMEDGHASDDGIGEVQKHVNGATVRDVYGVQPCWIGQGHTVFSVCQKMNLVYVEWMEFSTLVYHKPMPIGPDPDLHHRSGIDRKLLAVDVETVLIFCEDDLEARRSFLQSLKINWFVYGRSLIDIELHSGNCPASRHR